MVRIIGLIFGLTVAFICLTLDNIVVRICSGVICFMGGAVALTIVIDLIEGRPLDD